MERIIDLHMHTTCSDGALSPLEIVDEAKKNGVSTIAIADHDNTAAYTDELFEYAKSQEIESLPAVEMSTHQGKIGVHVLGYNFDLDNEQMINTLSKLRNARHDYLENVAKALENIGYKINTAKLDEIPAVTKAHISLDVVSNPENKPLLMQTFGHIPSKGEFIETIMNEGCPAYVQKFTINPVEAANIIHQAGGKVVLAHPVAYKHEDGIDQTFVLDLAKAMNADGIETNYIYVNREDQVIDETAFWNEIALSNGYFTTVGSDFHISDGLRPEIGLINTSFRLDDATIQTILNNLKK